MDAAVESIHEDLRRLSARRRRVFAVVLGAEALLIGALLALPGEGVERGARLSAAMLSFLFGSGAGASAVLGVPLWERRTVWALSGLGGAALLAGLVLESRWDAPAAGLSHDLECLLAGTIASLAALAAIAASSSGLRRRFPDPATTLAIGSTALGLAFLCSRCGVTHAGHVLGFHLATIGPSLIAARFISTRAGRPAAT